DQHRAVVAEDVIKLFADKSSELFHNNASWFLFRTSGFIVEKKIFKSRQIPSSCVEFQIIMTSSPASR
ncbi:MAG: hypothetical protein M0P50_14930, partial [Bacteroidales bacterium]|nr:hypothetical protein [Bacteroidales bacterium]